MRAAIKHTKRLREIVPGTLVAVVGIFGGSTAYAQGWGPGYGMGSGMMGGFGEGGWSLFGAVFMLLWWALLILGIVVLVRWLFGARRISASEDRALEILRERYARGEIDKNEYEARRKDLSA